MIHYDTNISLLKMCNDFIEEEDLEGFQSFDFDAHASINDLPNEGLIGVAEYSLMGSQNSHEGSCMILIASTQADSNLKILKPLVSKMYSKLHTGATFTLVDSTSGIVRPVGNIVIKDGTEAMPVARTKSRPLQGINIRFGLGLI